MPSFAFLRVANKISGLGSEYYLISEGSENSISCIKNTVDTHYVFVWIESIGMLDYNISERHIGVSYAITFGYLGVQRDVRCQHIFLFSEGWGAGRVA